MASSNSSSNKINVPEAREAMEKMKYEVANEIGVPLKKVTWRFNICTEWLCRWLYG